MRQKKRPKEPTSLTDPLDFVWLSNHCPDLKVLMDQPAPGQGRTLAFSTDFLLRECSQALTWCVDGTFKSRPAVYKDASSQVFSIHAFVGGPRGMKQFPMIFALMKHRTTEDYVILFEGLKRAFEEEGLPCRPEAFMLDFEAATWKALKICFPNATLNGCGFHFAKCLKLKWQTFGLQAIAAEEEAESEDLCKIYTRSQAMRHLPENLILNAFECIRGTSRPFPENHQVHKYVKYLQDTWMQSTVHPPSTWCQYRLPLRTNNDLEGWHRSYNQRVKLHPAFYLFLERTYAELVQTRGLIQTGDFQRRTAATTTANDAALQNIWEQLEGQETCNINDVLDSIARVFKYRASARARR